MPLHLVPFINKEVVIIPFIIYTPPLHVIKTIILYETNFVLTTEPRVDSTPIKVWFIVRLDGVLPYPPG